MTSIGRVGVLSSYNNAQFDDVSVADTNLTYLFRSGFNSPVALTTPICRSGYWFQTLTGTDAGGSSWPPRFWDPNPNPNPNRTNLPEVFNTNAPCHDPPITKRQP